MIVRSIAFVSALAGAAALALAASPPQRAMAHSDGHGHGHSHGFAAGEPGDDPTKANRVVEIIMTDGPGTMTYSPHRVEVRKGEQVRFVLKNIGHLPHEFVIDSFENNARHKIEMENNPDMEHHDPNGKRLDPKQSGEILWRFTKTGTFEFACLIPGHYESGMKGVVTVK